MRSVSGLKTAVMLAAREQSRDDQVRADLAAEFQAAVVDSLTAKCRQAMRLTRAGTLVVAGGVGANRSLRETLALVAAQERWRLFFPRLEFCTDNGAMIAYAGMVRLRAVERIPLNIEPRSGCWLDDLEAAGFRKAVFRELP